LFVFDPINHDNSPVPGVHDHVLRHWEIWPDDLKNLWIHTFTTGLQDPSTRTTLLAWMRVLSRVEDMLRRCDSCHKTTVASDPRSAKWTCWNCGARVAAGPRCLIHDSVVLLESGASLYRHHLDGRPTDADYTSALFSVVSNPSDPTILGLRNETQSTVSYVRPNGTSVALEPGRAAAILDGSELVTPKVTIKFRT
jgi:hypothetical protein